MLIFIPSVKVFSFVKPFMTEIAAAAYFIYLTHMFILHFIDKLTQNGPLRYALLVMFCLLAYRLYLKALDVFQIASKGKIRETMF